MMPISSGAKTRMPPIKKSERMVVMVSPFHSAVKKIKVDPSGLPVAKNRKNGVRDGAEQELRGRTRLDVNYCLPVPPQFLAMIPNLD